MGRPAKTVALIAPGSLALLPWTTWAIASCPSQQDPFTDLAGKILATYDDTIEINTHLEGELTPGWIVKDGRKWFQTRDGARVAEACFAPDRAGSKKADREAMDADANLRRMYERAESCAKKRGAIIPWHYLKNRMRFNDAKIDCLLNPKDMNAGAVSSAKTNTISFTDLHASDPYSFYHEFLHLAQVGNLTTAHHNDIGANENDEVYFWTKLCFGPGIWDFSPPGPMQFSDAGKCRRVLSIREIKTTTPVTREEIESGCRFYENAVSKEKALTAKIEEHLLPTVFGCAESDHGECAERDRLEKLLLKSGAMKSSFPKQGSSQADYMNWVRKECFVYDSNLSEAAQLLNQCIRTLTSAAVNDKPGASPSIEEHKTLARAAARANFLIDYTYPPKLRTDADDGRGQKTLAEAMKACSINPDLKGSASCAGFREMTGPIADFISYWRL